MANTRRGDRRHTVLLIPGFLTTDHANLPLATVVRANGCRPARTFLRRNVGPTAEVVEHLDRRFLELTDERGDITVAGVSLGGVFARRLARAYPDRVRQVITIGSPFRFDAERIPSRIVGGLWRRRESGFDEAAMAEMAKDEDAKPPLQVPETSIFSRMDGVVPFKRTLVSESAVSENIEVKYSSHVGLVVHPGVHVVLADRIRQRPGEWRPFRIPPGGQALIRRADYFDPAKAHKSKTSH